MGSKQKLVVEWAGKNLCCVPPGVARWLRGRVVDPMDLLRCTTWQRMIHMWAKFITFSIGRKNVWKSVVVLRKSVSNRLLSKCIRNHANMTWEMLVAKFMTTELQARKRFAQIQAAGGGLVAAAAGTKRAKKREADTAAATSAKKGKSAFMMYR